MSTGNAGRDGDHRPARPVRRACAPRRSPRRCSRSCSWIITCATARRTPTCSAAHAGHHRTPPDLSAPRQRRLVKNAPAVTVLGPAPRGAAGRGGPRQRTATQFMSAESVKISPRTVDLTYGSSPTMCARAACRQRAQRAGFGPAAYLSYIAAGCGGGRRDMAHPFVFHRYFSNDACRGVLMIAKRSSRALALLLALPSAAFALGLGDIHLLVVAQRAARCGDRAHRRRRRRDQHGAGALASRETLPIRVSNGRPTRQRAGATVRTPDGREIIKLKIDRSDFRSLRHAAGRGELVARPPGARVHHAARSAGLRARGSRRRAGERARDRRRRREGAIARNQAATPAPAPPPSAATERPRPRP